MSGNDLKLNGTIRFKTLAENDEVIYIKNEKPKGKGWKRDRMFLSKEKHEQAYEKKRKKPYKKYKHKSEENADSTATDTLPKKESDKKRKLHRKDYLAIFIIAGFIASIIFCWMAILGYV